MPAGSAKRSSGIIRHWRSERSYFASLRTASSTLWKTFSRGRASNSLNRSNASCARTDSSRASATVTPCSLHALNTSSRICAAVKSISTMPLASSTSSCGGVAPSTLVTSLRKPGALRNDSGACSPITATPTMRSPAMCGCAGHQIVVPGTRSNSTSRARRAPDAVQQRQHDAEERTLLDRQHDDQRGGGGDQQEFAWGLAIDRGDLLHADDAQRDEQQDAAEGCVWNVLQQSRSKREQRQHDPSGGETRELRLSAGLGDNARPRRAGFDRKRAEQARQYAAYARAEKIAIDIGRLVGI